MGVFEVPDAAGEDESTRMETIFEVGQELRLEQRRQNLYVDEEVLPAWHPAASLRRQSASGNNTVNMGMIHEVLPPGMQYSYEAYLCTEMLRIMWQCQKRFWDWAEKKIIRDLLIAKDKGIQFCGDGKDYMEVPNGKEVFSSGLNPLLFP